MHQISLWILLALVSSCYCKITIGAFNVRQFGDTKLKNKDVVNSLVEVIRGYDIVLIQEIIMSKDNLFKNFVENDVNKDLLTGTHFDYKLSQPLGPGQHKERYGFIYKTDAVKITKVYQHGDHVQFSRPPYCVEVEELSNADDRQVKPFWMVGLHTRPTNTICELQRLEDVYKKGFPQSPSPLRVVFLGDFNADCTYFKEYDEKKIPFLFDPNSAGMKMLPFKKDARTNVIGDQKCIYDRIVVSNSMLSEVQGQAEVGSFFVPKNKNREAVSDHYPIKLTLAGKKRAASPPNASPPNAPPPKKKQRTEGRGRRSN